MEIIAYISENHTNFFNLRTVDFGATWIETVLDDPVNPHAWQNWRASVAFPKPGYYEIWARAIDSEGVGQPHAIAWNPKGYLNNSMHRVAVTVGFGRRG